MYDPKKNNTIQGINLSFGSILFSNYKCFSFNKYTGLKDLKKLNLIIGKNNIGKTAILELLESLYAMSKNLGNDWYFELTLNSEDIKRFRKKFSSINKYDKNLVDRFFSVYDFQKNPFSIQVNGELLINDSPTDILVPDSLLNNDPNLKEIKYEIFNFFIESQLKDTAFIKLNADRDIVPEDDKDLRIQKNTIIHYGYSDSNGEFATNTIQNLLHKDWLESELIENLFLEEINKILNPDIDLTRITYRKRSDGKYEIYLRNSNNPNSYFPLSSCGSGFKTIFLTVLHLKIIPHILKENQTARKFIFAFEELENNLHPEMQRKVFNYILNFLNNNDSMIFLTTHSNVPIDLYSKQDNVSIYHINQSNGFSKINKINTKKEQYQIYYDLGFKASDILQANGIIWVEGPSDRIYIKKWIDLWYNDNTENKKKIEEGLHYQIMFYGGKLLSHLSIEHNETEIRDFIDLLNINRNCSIIIDSDITKKNNAINSTKSRIKAEFKNTGRFCWITDGKEIESYIPSIILNKVHNFGFKKMKEIDKDKGFIQFLSTYKKELGYNFDKMKFSRLYVKEMTLSNMQNRWNLSENINSLIKEIKKWNINEFK